MSGELRTTVPLYEDEHNKLMAAVQLISDHEKRQKTMRNQMKKTEFRLSKAVSEGERRQKEFDRTVDALSRKSQESAREVKKKLQIQQQQSDKKFTDIDQRIKQINTSMRGIEHDVDHINRDIREKESNLKEIAEQWYADAKKIIDHIDTCYRHNQFKEGSLKNLKKKNDFTVSNIRNNMFEAAASKGQDVFFDALALQAELEIFEQEWHSCYKEALESMHRILAECISQESSQFVFKSEDSEKKINAEIDYWTDGKLKQLKRNAQDQLELLEGEDKQLTLDQLKSIIRKSSELQKRSNIIGEEARGKLIASQARRSIAEDLVNALEEQGWQVIDNAWEGEENDKLDGWKNSLNVKLKNVDNNEMVTVIIPRENCDGEVINDLQFAYYPINNNDSKFATKQTSYIQRILNKLMSTDVQLKCMPGCEDTFKGRVERKDFEKIRQGKSKPY